MCMKCMLKTVKVSLSHQIVLALPYLLKSVKLRQLEIFKQVMLQATVLMFHGVVSMKPLRTLFHVGMVTRGVKTRQQTLVIVLPI